MANFPADEFAGFRAGGSSMSEKWEEERGMLLNMVAKSQQVASTMQQKLDEATEEHDLKYTVDVGDLRREIATLRQENKLLRELPTGGVNMSGSSQGSDAKTKQFVEGLRGQLVGEIDRLERAYVERETELQN